MVNKRKRTTLTAAALAIGFMVVGPAASQTDHATHRAADAATHESLDSANAHGIDVAFELLDRDGNLVTAEDYRGRYVLLGFRVYELCPHLPDDGIEYGQGP